MSLPEKLFIHPKKNTSLGKDVDTLIEKTLEESQEQLSTSNTDVFKLPIDLIETENTYIILSPVPGIPVKNIEISLDNDVLTVSGETQKATFVKGKTVYKECAWGSFSRSITLPNNIKRTGHKANVKNGMLTVILPKTKKKSAKQIPVTSYDD